MRQLSLALLIVSIATAAPLSRQQPAPGFADRVLGAWDVTVNAPEGTYPSWFDVRLRTETSLMAGFVGRFGSLRHASSTTYGDGTLRIRIPVQYEQNKSDLVFDGRLNGERLEGTTEDAKGNTLKWTAVRAPDLRRKSPPTWGDPLELFNGKDLSGWKLRSGTAGCWQVSGGLLTNTPPCVDLISERTFGDFKARVEFNIVPKSNSGVYLRGRYEAQINDDRGMAADSLRSGGVYGFLRPSTNAAAAPGTWQTYDITLAGRRVTVVLNGQTVVDDSEIPGITGGALDSAEGTPGPLMVQGDHGRISVRRVTVTPAR